MTENMQERISIIVPVYNAGGSLEACVDSLLASEGVQTEILLIDDGSRDDSGKLCDRLAAEHDNIRVIHQENRGVSCARNEGLRAASGDYVTFVDADDAIDPRMLSFLLGLIHRDGSSIAGCAVRRTSVPASVPEGEEIPAGSDVYTGEEYLRQRFLHGDHSMLKLFSGSTVEGCFFPEGMTIGEDMLFLLSAIRPGIRISMSGARLYYYYFNESGAMEKPFVPSYFDQIRCWEEAEKEIGSRFPELSREADVRAAIAAQKVTGSMLVIGKLSGLPAEQRNDYSGQISEIRRKVKENLAVPGCREALPKGYSLKADLFCRMPALYLGCYGQLRRRFR